MDDPPSYEHELKLRNLILSDYPDIESIMDIVYDGIGGAWRFDEFKNLIDCFPNGQICIEDKGRVVAAALSLIVSYDDFENAHCYEDIINNGGMDGHDPDGTALYGIDVFVHPEYRGLRLGRRLYDARKELCETLNLKCILFGGRIPGYSKYQDQLTPQEYIGKVKNNELYDPVLSFQLKNDFHIRKVMKNYLPEDEKSMSYGVLMEWNNIYYEKKKRLFGGARAIRV